jgi:DNA-binding MarR family transcriptional regulator
MEVTEDQAIQDIADNMLSIWRHMMGRRRVSSRNDGISRVQGIVLTIAGHHEGLSIKDVAERMGISGSAATQLVDLSVREGFLSREVDPHDRRVMRITITPSGRNRLEDFRKVHIGAMRDMLAALDDKEKETFRSLLKKIVAAKSGSPDTGRVK